MSLDVLELDESSHVKSGFRTLETLKREPVLSKRWFELIGR